MANLKVKIVVRVTDPDGKRSWVPATGKNDPKGPFYLRYYEGSSPKHVKAGRFYDEAPVTERVEDTRFRNSRRASCFLCWRETTAAKPSTPNLCFPNPKRRISWRSIGGSTSAPAATRSRVRGLIAAAGT
jgi:hypothetical protein